MLNGKSLEVLWKVLARVLREIGVLQKVLRRELGEIGGALGTPHPDPLTLAKKSKENPEKSQAFLFAEALKSLEKKGKTHKKQGKSESEKNKSKEARIGG